MHKNSVTGGGAFLLSYPGTVPGGLLARAIAPRGEDEQIKVVTALRNARRGERRTIIFRPRSAGAVGAVL